NGTTGPYQATEQIRLTLPSARLRLVIHLTVDLSAMKRIEQFVVAWRHLEAGQYASPDIIRPVCRYRLADQHKRQVLIPLTELFKQFHRTALGGNLTEHHSQYAAA